MNIAPHDDRCDIATINKRWSSVADSYGTCPWILFFFASLQVTCHPRVTLGSIPMVSDFCWRKNLKSWESSKLWALCGFTIKQAGLMPPISVPKNHQPTQKLLVWSHPQNRHVWTANSHYCGHINYARRSADCCLAMCKSLVTVDVVNPSIN